jgi:multidrug efflux pump subunit AcrB
MTNIPKYSVQYPVTVLMFFLGTILLGLISFTNLPINLFPDIRYPRITVVTETQGLAPEEVERRISEPLERLMAGIRNVQQVSSISRADQSVVMVDFVWGSDMDYRPARREEGFRGPQRRIPVDERVAVRSERPADSALGLTGGIACWS